MKGWNKNGVSIILVKTPKGHELIRRLDTSIFHIEETDAAFAVKHNSMYYQTRPKPDDYAKFCSDLKTYGLHRAVVNHVGFINYYTNYTPTLRKYASYFKRAVKKVLRILTGKV